MPPKLEEYVQEKDQLNQAIEVGLEQFKTGHKISAAEAYVNLKYRTFSPWSSFLTSTPGLADLRYHIPRF